VRGTSVACLSTVILLAGLGPVVVWATDSNEPELAMDVPAVFVVSLDVNQLEYNATEQNLVDGETEAQTIIATVQANSNWVMNIYGDSAIWTGPWNKPVGDILWSVDGSAFTPLETGTMQITSGGPTAGNNKNIDIKISLDITEDLPGDYEYENIVVEVSAP